MDSYDIPIFRSRATSGAWGVTEAVNAARTPSFAGRVDRVEIRAGRGPKPIPATAPSAAGEYMIASYNVENLFDAKDDPNVADEEFTPSGRAKWTEAKVAQKVQNLGRVIRAMNGGRGPDILGLMEVENRGVCERLCREGLKGLGYTSIAHVDSEDGRGIDCAIISKHPMVGQPTLHRVHDLSDPLWTKPTRGILEATFNMDGNPVTVFVNHWPSKRGGEIRNAQRLEIAKQLRGVIDAKLEADPSCQIMVMGDFNANPSERPMTEGLGGSTDPSAVRERRDGARLYNTVASVMGSIAGRWGKAMNEVDTWMQRNGVGTHTHRSRWGTYDQILMTGGLLNRTGLTMIPGSAQIMREPFMMTGRDAPSRFQPPGRARAQLAARNTGFSDHLPFVVRLRRAAAAQSQSSAITTSSS